MIWVEKKNQSTNQTKKGKNNQQEESPLKVYARYAGMGTQMLVIILIFVWAGKKLDEHAANKTPVFTAILSLLGVIVALYTVLKDFIRKDDDDSNK